MYNNWPQAETYNDSSELQFLTSGDPWFSELKNLIRLAREEIHIQVYILEPDETGLEIIELLLEAAKRGVKVYVVADAVGSENLSPEMLAEWNRQGIFIRLFGPIHVLKLRVGRRLHHKVVVVDQVKALIGGINIANKYKGVNDLPWLDFGVSLSGPVVEKARRFCEDILNKSIPLIAQKRKKQERNNPSPTAFSRISVNDLVRQRRGIASSYRSAFRSAEKEIIIVASYFLPGFTIRNILKKASARGVRVRLIVAETSDVRIAKRATDFLYDWMFRYNFEISEYQPSVLHGKLAVVDRKWMTVGSYNLNDLSELSSIEVNVDILGETMAGNTAEYLEGIIEGKCRKVTLEDFKKRTGPLNQFLNFLSYIIVRASFRLMFLLTKNDRENILL